VADEDVSEQRLTAKSVMDSLNAYERAEVRFLTAKPEEFVVVRMIYISVVGSHKDILARNEPGYNALIPRKPDRDLIRDKYAEGISRHRSMRAILIQEAEQTGKIDSLIEQEWINSLNDKVSLLHQVAAELGIINAEAVGKAAAFCIPLEGGGVRQVMKTD
jgi:hypothetical protein